MKAEQRTQATSAHIKWAITENLNKITSPSICTWWLAKHSDLAFTFITNQKTKIIHPHSVKSLNCYHPDIRKWWEWSVEMDFPMKFSKRRRANINDEQCMLKSSCRREAEHFLPPPTSPSPLRSLQPRVNIHNFDTFQKLALSSRTMELSALCLSGLAYMSKFQFWFFGSTHWT